MSRTKIRQIQANRSLISFRDLQARYKTYQVGFSIVLASTSSISPTIGQVVITGASLIDLELEANDVITISGTGTADGDYRILQIVDDVTLQVTTTSALAATSGVGTADFYYQEGSAYIGVDDLPWTIIAGTRLQTTLNSIDTQLQNTIDLIPTSLSNLPIGTGSQLPYITDLRQIVQGNLAQGKMRAWLPAGNSTTVSIIGSAAPTARGTATARNVALTSYFTMQKRIGFVSANTAGSTSGYRLPLLQYATGATSGGGFLLVARFGVSDAATVANSRLFVGMINATGVIGNVNPSTLTNIVGVASNAGDANLSIMHNDGAGTATIIPLGANFPAQTLSVDAYTLVLYAPIGQTYVEWYILRENTGADAQGRITTDLPTTLLAIQLWRNNGVTAAAVGLDVMGVQIQ